MLLAGGVTCVFTFINNYTITQKVISISIVLVVFLILGSVLKWTFDRFDEQNRKDLEEKGEVIDKTEDENAK